MEKSLVRAFIFSLIAFFILNFLFTIIGNAIYQSLEYEITRFAEHPTFILFRLMYPIHYYPWRLIELMIVTTEIGLKIMYIGFFASLIIASIIAGLTGGDIIKSVGGWILTSITCIFLFIIILMIDPFNQGFFCIGCILGEAIMYAIIPIVVNILIFSGVTLLTALLIGRSK